MRASPVTNSRLIRLLATVVALGVEIGGAEARANPGPDPVALAAVPGELEERIEALIHSWFAVLEDPTAKAETLGGLLAEAPFELMLAAGTLRDRSALLAWVSDLRATYPRIDYRLDRARIQAEGPDRYRVRFEFDRHALDEAGLPHVARREHTWIVKSDAIVDPVILKIEERPLLFSGSGPQIVCY